jgi:hypothetical protein
MCPGEDTSQAGEPRGDHTGVDPVPVRARGVMAEPFQSSRRLVTAAVRAGRRIVPMHGLFEVDITTARRLLAEQPSYDTC